MVGPVDVAAALAMAARDIKGPQDLDVTLDTIVQVARDSTPSIDQVGISVMHLDGRIETRAKTDAVVTMLDELQCALSEGPSMHVMDTDSTVRVEHARHEQRWPQFIPRAIALGLRAQLGIRLNTGGHTVGVLNLYSFSVDVLDDETTQLAELFAAHAGLALGHAERLEHLNAALASRKTIGVALGILMERLGIDEDTAFSYLTRISSSSQTKLRDVASTIVAEVVTRDTVAEPLGPASTQAS
jgi:GAF domain-containing protein